jgi:uncharacterized protein YbjT (DUF2867 family)
LSDLIAVTGATGALGGRVVGRLAERDATLRLVVRDETRAPALGIEHEIAVASGYADRHAMTEAFRGADTVFLVSGRESPNRVEEHFSAVDAAADAGVRRIVYTSFITASPDSTFTLARDHWETEERVREAGLAFTFLRNQMYLDFVPYFARPDGVIAGPAGDGRTAWVSRDDVADVAAEVLLSDEHDGQTYELTGPEAHSLEWAADVLSDVCGVEVVYEDETIEEAYASRAHYGAPDYEVEGWVTSYVAVAEGELDVVTGAVEHLTGHPPQTLREYLEEYPESYEHLTG